MIEMDFNKYIKRIYYHIGIIIENKDASIIVAEGNILMENGDYLVV
ncbi:MAG: hypothetical protein LBD23_07875 [Oscillospiraceae bacterium]|jgi:hypothetical protein|nr:hypothetical protein [Oscillospiraceae bacterium]